MGSANLAQVFLKTVRFSFLKRKSLGLIALLALFCAGCAQQMVEPQNDPKSLYNKTLQSFDLKRPGYGLDTGFKEEKLDYPMAYALFVSAESHRYLQSKEDAALQNIITGVTWLIENKELSGDIGWGLPFAWDAFGDGSVNNEHTIYTITTALVIQALLDATDAIHAAEQDVPLEPQVLIDTANSAIKTFLQGKFIRQDGELIFWYSVNPEDDYHVLNVSSMLTGQIQRLSQYLSIPESEALSLVADEGFSYVIERMVTDENGNIQWMYGGDDWPNDRANRPNDLVHEAYVIQGIIDYVRYGGKKSELIQPNSLYKSLNRYLESENVYEMPRSWQPNNEAFIALSETSARLWGIGYAIYVTKLMEARFEIEPQLSSQFYCVAINNYFDSQRWYFKPDKQDRNLYPRQVAHILVGLASVYDEEINCLNESLTN